MEFEGLAILIITGGVAGWLAALLLRHGSMGIVGNIIVGVVGAYLGTYLFDFLDIRFNNYYIGALSMATVGAAILLILLSILHKLTSKKK